MANNLDFNSLAPRGANQDFKTCLDEYLNFNSLAPRGANRA